MPRSARASSPTTRRCGSSAGGSSTPTTSTTRRATATTARRRTPPRARTPRASSRTTSPARERPPLLRSGDLALRRRCQRRTSSRSGSSGCAASTARSACTARSASSCGCSSATCRRSGRRVPDYDDYLTRRAVRGDGPDGHARRRRGRRPLHRPHAERREAARAVRPDRGVAHEPRAGDPAVGHARLGQDALHGARSSTRRSSPARPICDIDPKGDHHLERLPGVEGRMEMIELSADDRYPRHARPAADRPRGHPRGPRLQLPLLDPARAAVTRVADRDPARRPDRGRREAGHRAAPTSSPSSRAATTTRATRPARSNIHASSGLAQLGFGTQGAPRRPRSARRRSRACASAT